MQTRRQFIILLLTFGFLLSGCMSLPRGQQSEPNNQILTWDARKKQLSTFQSWTVTGALAAKNQKQQGGQLRFAWVQRGDQYTIDLTAPLGGMIAQISGKPGAVTLQKANAPAVQGQTPEAVFVRELGWYFPVSDLQYWIRGLPANAKASANATTSSTPAMTFDAYNHLQSLKEQDWDITFERYTRVRGVDVPGKIILKHPTLLIRLVVTSWA